MMKGAKNMENMEKIRQVRLTTEDNPYDPFDEFEKWYNFDERNGYHTCSYLDRVVATSKDTSEEDRNMALEEAIDEIIKINLTGNYKKVIKTYP